MRVDAQLHVESPRMGVNGGSWLWKIANIGSSDLLLSDDANGAAVLRISS